MSAPTSLRVPQPTAPSNMFQHNLPGPHHGHQSQTSSSSHHAHSQSISPPPPPTASANALNSTHTHAAHHLPQTLPNLLIQHQTSMAVANNQMNHHHHHHHHHQALGAEMHGLQTPNSVIQNMMHNASLMHLPNMPPMLSNHAHHHPHLNNEHGQHTHGVGNNLDIGPLHLQSSPAHMQSPSNRSNQSHHGGNSLDSPIPPAPPSRNTMKSPTQGNLGDGPTHMSDQHVLVHNAALSPSEMNSNPAGSTDVSASSQSDNTNVHEPRHRAHVIDSITISPGNSHNFKMEDM